MHYAFNTNTFGSIKKFLNIIEFIPNVTCTTSSNFIPFDVMQKMLITKRGLYPLQDLYYLIKKPLPGTFINILVQLLAFVIGILIGFIFLKVHSV